MASDRHFRMIVHGARADDPDFEWIVAALRDGGNTVSVRPTWEQDDAAELAREGVAAGADVLVAAGGDGTLHEVVNGLMRHGLDVALGVLPLGTANDFANAAGYPVGDRESLLELLRDSVPRQIDVLRVDERFFINAATGGFAARAASQASPGIKRVFGGLAYFLAGIAHLGAVERTNISFEGPGVDWSGPCLGFAVTNARFAGGGHRVCPNASIDDGLLDVVVIPGTQSLLDAARVAPDLKFEPDEEHALRWQAPWVAVEVEEAVPLNVDGEPFEFTRSRFEVCPRAARMLLPRDCPLLSETREPSA